MRKNYGVKPYCYPMPALMIATYNDDGTPNAMLAAWGGISEANEISITVDSVHKTVANVLARKAFTVSFATEKYVVPCDYLGIVSGKKEPRKFEIAGFHATKSEFVDAPIIDELLVAIECTLVSYDPETDRMIGRIVNVSADESVLGEDGKVDPLQLSPVVYDPIGRGYYTLGKRVGSAFRDGTALKKTVSSFSK